MLGLRLDDIFRVDGHETILQTFSNKRTVAQLFYLISESRVVTRFPRECYSCVATREVNRCIARIVGISFQIWFSGQVALDYGVQRELKAYVASK